MYPKEHHSLLDKGKDNVGQRFRAVNSANLSLALLISRYDCSFVLITASLCYAQVPVAQNMSFFCTANTARLGDTVRGMCLPSTLAIRWVALRSSIATVRAVAGSKFQKHDANFLTVDHQVCHRPSPAHPNAFP